MSDVNEQFRAITEGVEMVEPRPSRVQRVSRAVGVGIGVVLLSTAALLALLACAKVVRVAWSWALG